MRHTLLAVTLIVSVAVTAATGDPDRAATEPGHLRVTLLGTGNPRPTIERFGPSILIEAGGRRILLDAGRGATIRLLQIGGAAAVGGIDAVLLTHLHSDHVVGLPDVWLTGWIFGRSTPLRVFGPAGTREMTDHLVKAYAFDLRMRRDIDEKLPAAGAVLDARELESGVVFDEGDLRIRAFRVDHRPVVPALGYRIDYGGRSVAFSGDTRSSDALVHHAKGVDVLVHEVVAPEVERRRALVQDPAVVQRIIDHHTTPEEAGRIFARVRPRLAVYSHIVPSPTTAADLIPPTRTTYDGPLEVGEDLMTIEIGERVVVGRPLAK